MMETLKTLGILLVLVAICAFVVASIYYQLP